MSGIRSLGALALACSCTFATGALRAESGEAQALRNRLYGSIVPTEEMATGQVVGQCVTLGGAHLSRVPFSSEAEIDAFVDNIAWEAVARYQATSSLTSTTYNPVVEPRAPIVVTYSLVPDGTIVEAQPGVAGSTEGPSELFAVMDAAFADRGESIWREKIAQAFERMGQLTAIEYLEVPDDGAAFPSSAGAQGKGGPIRGDVRIAMRPFAGIGGDLSYGLSPNTSDIVLDSLDIDTWTLEDADYRALRNIVMHEHCHGLGLSHVEPLDRTKLMESVVTLDYDGPQEDDIRGLQYLYSDDYTPNDMRGGPHAFHLGELEASAPIEVLNASIGLTGTVDWFAFHVEDPYSDIASFFLTPAGSTYIAGPEGGPTTTIRATTVHALQLDLFDNQGNQLLATGDRVGAGIPIRINYFPFRGYPAGTYYVRITSANGGATNEDVQRYELSIYSDRNRNRIPDSDDIADTEFAEGADNCHDAAYIEPGITYTGSTDEAGNDGRPACGLSNSTPDVWYAYTPNRNGTIDLSLCSSGYDTTLSVHRNCSETSFASACNDDSNVCSVGAKTSYLSAVPVVAGENYLIRVSGFRGATGEYSLFMEGPDTNVGRSNDNNSTKHPDETELPIPFANYTPFDPEFSYGETSSEPSSIPSVLAPSNIPGFQGSAPNGTSEIGFSSTREATGTFATWRRNLAMPLQKDTIYRVGATLRTDATLGDSNWVRLRFGGDFQELNGISEFGIFTNGASLPTGPREVELYHWSKRASEGTSEPGQPDQPALSFDIIDQSSSIGGHLAAISNVTVDMVARQAFGTPKVLRNKGLPIVYREDGATPPSAGRTNFITPDGYAAGIVNDPGSSVTVKTSKSFPYSGALNLTFGTTAPGNQTGFAAAYVDQGVSLPESRIKAETNKVYMMDVWISPAAAPNRTTQRPPIMRLRFSPEQVSFNHGQIATATYNLNPDPNFDGVYDNWSGLTQAGKAKHYMLIWSPSLDTDIQNNSNSNYFVDFLFDRTGTSAVRPTGTYTIQRLVVTECEKPVFGIPSRPAVVSEGVAPDAE